MKPNWELKTLGAISAINYGYTDSASSEPVGPRFLRITDIQDDRVNWESVPYCKMEPSALSKYRLASGDIVFARTGATTGKSFLVDDPPDAVFASYLIRLRLLDKRLLPEFVWLFFQTAGYWKSIKDGSAGSAQGGFNATKLGALSIPIPPLFEQHRIVDILDQAFTEIVTAKANAEQNLQNASGLFDSLLNLAIQGKLVRQNSHDTSAAELIGQIETARNVAIGRGSAKPEKTSPVTTVDESRIRLPRSWIWAHLESLTVGISDGVHKKPHYTSDGIPFITVKNLTAGPGISFDDINYITPKDHKEFIKRTHPENGDILITKDGTIGVVRLIETDIEFSIFVSVALIKPVMRELGPYLVYALRASCVQSQIVPQGAALKHLYLVDLRRLTIPLPPLAEQQRIIAALDALDIETQRLATVYERKLGRLEALKKSLLHSAFSGEL